jgi:flagellar capping protein FliD
VGFGYCRICRIESGYTNNKYNRIYSDVGIGKNMSKQIIRKTIFNDSDTAIHFLKSLWFGVFIVVLCGGTTIMAIGGIGEMFGWDWNLIGGVANIVWTGIATITAGILGYLRFKQGKQQREYEGILAAVKEARSIVIDTLKSLVENESGASKNGSTLSAQHHSLETRLSVEHTNLEKSIDHLQHRFERRDTVVSQMDTGGRQFAVLLEELNRYRDKFIEINGELYDLRHDNLNLQKQLEATLSPNLEHVHRPERGRELSL